MYQVSPSFNGGCSFSSFIIMTFCSSMLGTLLSSSFSFDSSVDSFSSLSLLDWFSSLVKLVSLSPDMVVLIFCATKFAYVVNCVHRKKLPFPFGVRKFLHSWQKIGCNNVRIIENLFIQLIEESKDSNKYCKDGNGD